MRRIADTKGVDGDDAGIDLNYAVNIPMKMAHFVYLVSYAVLCIVCVRIRHSSSTNEVVMNVRQINLHLH